MNTAGNATVRFLPRSFTETGFEYGFLRSRHLIDVSESQEKKRVKQAGVEQRFWRNIKNCCLELASFVSEETGQLMQLKMQTNAS